MRSESAGRTQQARGFRDRSMSSGGQPCGHHRALHELPRLLGRGRRRHLRALPARLPGGRGREPDLARQAGTGVSSFPRKPRRVSSVPRSLLVSEETPPSFLGTQECLLPGYFVIEADWEDVASESSVLYVLDANFEDLIPQEIQSEE